MGQSNYTMLGAENNLFVMVAGIPGRECHVDVG